MTRDSVYITFSTKAVTLIYGDGRIERCEIPKGDFVSVEGLGLRVLVPLKVANIIDKN